MVDSNIETVKNILNEIIYINVATVDGGGQPWNTALYSAFDEEYNYFWVSDRQGQHSKNVGANEKVFLSVYDSTVPEGTGVGVFILAKAYELGDEKEILHALGHLYGRKNKTPRRAEEFLGKHPRRVYKAVPEKFWLNGAGKVNGNFIDTRVEVDLIGQTP